jgi:glycosyltransferase involved in cell wall biosynthesis
MKISILISSYNKSSYLDKCIQSCLDQTHKNFEIILLDNYSTDDTNLILRKYEKKLIIKKEERVSSYSAVNQIDLLKKALSISSGDIICLLDADDYFKNDKLEKIDNIFSQNTRIDVTFDKPKILINNNYNNFKIKKKLSRYIWPTIFPTSSISVKRSFLKSFFENKNLYSYPTLEIDFRITSLSQMIYKNFFITNENITVYRNVSDGIMANIKKFSKKWWIKRLDAHYFINDIYLQNKKSYKKNYDFYLTKSINYLLNIGIK